ncbi:TIGR03617 family F420-dependent LLM class oxidoreductase [Myxococcota bacterium]|nr:TIGR03617 family F420-dependent LLM class oxidoreductase [Myxococcota bacterium]MCZ7620235.1 TIGR03617 family F420-dependent LLM class oxidoreductase [Myxococcota bacterium]
MRIETTLPLGHWRTVAAAAQRAEALGFDGLTTPEIANDPFVPLAFAALATERIQLGTAIAVAFPRSPMVVANLAWDLQRESQGRFVLGLGPQVKGHNERRFSVPWSAPVPRLREYVESLRAIWRCWELGEPLDYEGEHYRFTLMTPEFSPPATGLPPVPITIAAVGKDMIRLAGRVCDGVRLHGFCTRRYLEQVALPRVVEGLERSGRARERFEVWGGGFIATGRTPDEVAKQVEWCRYRVAFYGSTRSYAPVLSIHGWDDLAAKLHEMSKRGQWRQMAAQIPDDVLHEFAAIAPYDQLVGAVEKRFGGLVDSVAIGFPDETPDGLAREIIEDLRRIPQTFAGFPARWS